MCANGMRSAAREGKCDGDQSLSAGLAANNDRELARYRFRGDVADEALSTGIAPGPAEAVVEHCEGVSGLEVGQSIGVFRWTALQRRIRTDHTVERLGIMGGDDLAGERPVGEVLAIGVESRIGRV